MSDYRCTEAFYHGPADAYGRCPWCGNQYTSVQPKPQRFDISNLTYYYGLYYDPDFPYDYEPRPLDESIYVC